MDVSASWVLIGGANRNFLSSPDMIRRRSLRTRAIKMLVLDEADEMLNKGQTGVGVVL